MNPHFLIFLILFVSLPLVNLALLTSTETLNKHPNNETIYKLSQKLCYNCPENSTQFLYEHNLVRIAKNEQPLMWDYKLEKYAKWWAGKRKSDCELTHSFPEDKFELGENIFWGGGSAWTPRDAVTDWADEEKYYDYKTNSCKKGEMCGHYTQIVWKDTRKLGCARVVCDNGDVFITCNYYPPGDYDGEKPY